MQKKNNNVKLSGSIVKKSKAKKKELIENNEKISNQDEVGSRNVRNSKKRKRKISDIEGDIKNTKKTKLSLELDDQFMNKNECNKLSKVNKGNNKNVYQSNKRRVAKKQENIASKQSNNEIHKELKLNPKEKRNKIKNNNQNKQKIEKININTIQGMLLTKKCKSKKNIAEPVTLRDRMMTQLRASRFRYLNETLYNNQSFESRKMFKEDPDAFKAYHTGYRQQVEQWPLNPLDVIITAVKKMPKDYVIADFGCGEARLADSVEQKVTSLDLVAINDNVIACDMAHTPLLTNGINVVVFCLSLMGSNLSDYVLEANRVLKKDGILKIADIESRFENIDEFIKSLENYGFKNTWKDLSHNLFYFMDFKKISDIDRKSKKLITISLKSCLYKKR